MAPASQRSVEQERDDLLEIVRLLPDVLFRCVKHDDGKIYWTLNEGGLAEEFHLTTDEIRGKSLEELFAGGASDEMKDHFEAAFEGKITEFVNEMGGRYFRHYPQPVFREDGGVDAVVGFIADVTDLVTTEKELERANEDLEAFTHTVSHDLRTPLAAMGNLVQVLQMRSGELDAATSQVVDRLAALTTRMDGMVQGLLGFGSAGQAPIVRTALDLSALAHEVGEGLRSRWPEHDVDLQIEPGLHAEGDASLVQTVLENLLQNAWKYTLGRPGTKIEVRSAQGGFEVSDNGPGFPAELDPFAPFARGADVTALEGTGIGLATVARIVERHGGRIWADGSKGATFGFTLQEETA